MIDFNRPIAVTTAGWERFADDLQGNILRYHARPLVECHLFRFGADPKADARALARHVTSALDHQEAVSAATPIAQVGLGFTASGCQAVGLLRPRDDAFRAGMRARAVDLGDDLADWTDTFGPDPWHGVMVLAFDPDQAAEADVAASARAAVQGLDSARIDGRAGENGSFGFLDGISNPILLTDHRGTGQAWNPVFPLSQAVFADLDGDHADSPASLLVLRRLTIDPAAFGAHDPVEQAAMVGRQLDGTALASDASADDATKNDFVYRLADDACPIASHVRTSNPRRRSAHERDTLFVRRGIPLDAADTKGLLFLAFNSSIETQFERMQRDWILAADFPVAGAGPDALLDPGAGFVTATGGEYFVMPSRSALRKL